MSPKLLLFRFVALLTMSPLRHRVGYNQHLPIFFNHFQPITFIFPNSYLFVKKKNRYGNNKMFEYSYNTFNVGIIALHRLNERVSEQWSVNIIFDPQ